MLIVVVVLEVVVVVVVMLLVLVLVGLHSRSLLGPSLLTAAAWDG